MNERKREHNENENKKKNIFSMEQQIQVHHIIWAHRLSESLESLIETD